ncbi:hypothetical protein [Cyclobacterium xiamenense]|uniref:hypothetical protein n=1 Tax=Cyclobacterium xiamenense TaxID=1297121 RepID=UPI0035CF7AF0
MVTKKVIVINIIKIKITLVVIVIADRLFNDYYNSLDKAYTIGELGKTYKPYGQGTKIRFSFTFQGEVNNSQNGIGNNEIKKGQKTYLIEVPIKDIRKSRILWDYPVPDTLKAPYEGWEEIPAFLKKKEGD